MENQPYKNTINALYIMLVISTVLGFVPNLTAFLISAALWLTVLMSAYFYRSKDKEDGLLYNHTTYLIGTVWIGTSFILLGAALGGYWIYTQGDNSAIDAFTAQIDAGTAEVTDSTAADITAQYMIDNKDLILKASVATVGPAILYFVYRIGNGFSRACKGYRIANPKSWL